MTATHYDVLGLTPSSTHEEVRSAYIDRALRFHPDRQEHQDLAGRADAERQMQAANAAWAVLGDREARAAYDAELILTGQLVLDEPEAPESLLTRTPLRTNLARIAPLLIVLAVLGAIFVFTAYAGSGTK